MKVYNRKLWKEFISVVKVKQNKRYFNGCLYHVLRLSSFHSLVSCRKKYKNYLTLFFTFFFFSYNIFFFFHSLISYSWDLTPIIYLMCWEKIKSNHIHLFYHASAFLSFLLDSHSFTCIEFSTRNICIVNRTRENKILCTEYSLNELKTYELKHLRVSHSKFWE